MTDRTYRAGAMASSAAGPGRSSRSWDAVLLTLRLALGFVFVVAGMKLIVPGPFGLGDSRSELVSSFTDPETGWMAPWLVERIEDIGISISTFLLIQGAMEVALASMLIVGLATPMAGTTTAMMLVMFTVAAPTGGAIRISRDIALAMVALLLARSGGGRWSVDRWLVAQPTSARDGRYGILAGIRRTARTAQRDKGLLLLRLGMAYTLLASAAVTTGVFANPMNESLPAWVLLLAGVALATGLAPRQLMGAITAWLLVVSLDHILGQQLLVGVEAVKRELVLMCAAAVYALVGPDRWSLPRPTRLSCRQVTTLLLAYLDGELSLADQTAIRAHLDDCPDCWAFLRTYRETIAIGRELQDEALPPAVHSRLAGLLTDTN